jgi:PadR family transcriptional regulator, regulatory protein PadR
MRASILPGSLDLLILKALSLGPQHGYGVLLRVEQITGEGLLIEQGALYPALHKLEHQGAIEAEWGVSDNNRRAKFYSLTPAGRKLLKKETDNWERFSSAIAAALKTRPEEV